MCGRILLVWKGSSPRGNVARLVCIWARPSTVARRITKCVYKQPVCRVSPIAQENVSLRMMPKARTFRGETIIVYTSCRCLRRDLARMTIAINIAMAWSVNILLADGIVFKAARGHVYWFDTNQPNLHAVRLALVPSIDLVQKVGHKGAGESDQINAGIVVFQSNEKQSLMDRARGFGLAVSHVISPFIVGAIVESTLRIGV